MNWYCKKFDELEPGELYALLQLRNLAFIIEQTCIYPDMDDKDQMAYHLMGWDDDKLLAYTRLLPKGISYPDYPSIGRVVVSSAIRKTGLGKELMQRSIQQCHVLFGNTAIKIGAQLYLQKFYESLGFVQSSEVYDEDGIPHIEMILPAQ
jgi:ElaA protein